MTPADLDRLQADVRAAFLRALDLVASATQRRLIEDHLRAGNIDAAVQALRLDATFFAPLDRMVAEAYFQGGVVALAGLPRLRDPFPVDPSSSDLTGATHGPRNGPADTPER